MSKTTTTPCPQCGGRKVISVGPDEVPCSACDGTGKVKAKYVADKPSA